MILKKKMFVFSLKLLTYIKKVLVFPGNIGQSCRKQNLTVVVLLSTQNQDSMLKRLKDRIFTLVKSARELLSPCKFP